MSEEFDIKFFLDNLKYMEDDNQIDIALDYLYDEIDKLMTESRLDVIDSILGAAIQYKFKMHVAAGLLVITLPVMSKLKSRSNMHEYFLKELCVENHITKGLEWKKH
jgi:hypothetical protein